MWESPIEVIQSEIRTEFEDNCLKAVQSYGFLVDKTELTRALSYDRKQYEKGYAEAIDEFAEAISEMASEVSERCTFPGGLTMDVVTLDGISEIVLEIASQLKGGTTK